MTEEVRRQRHNEAEKRRQKRISDQVNELKDYMTQLGFDVKPGKAAILTATLKHMRELTEQTLRLRQGGGGRGPVVARAGVRLRGGQAAGGRAVPSAEQQRLRRRGGWVR